MLVGGSPNFTTLLWEGVVADFHAKLIEGITEYPG